MNTKEIKNNSLQMIVLKVLLVVAVAVAGLAFSTADSHAASAPVLKQTSAYTNSVYVAWNAIDGASYYRVQYSSSASGPFVDNSYNTYVSSPTTSINNRSAGTTTYVRVAACNSSKTAISGWSAPFAAVTQPQATPAVSQSKLGNSTNAIQLNSYAVSGANYYVIKLYRSGESSSTAKVIRTTSSRLKLTKLATNTKYNVQVVPVRRSPSGFNATSYSYGTAYDLRTVPTKVTGVKLDTFYPNINYADLEWGKRGSASGFHYYVANDTGKKKVVSGTTTATSYSTNGVTIVKKMKINRFYKVKVRAFITVNGTRIYGAWSNPIYVSGGSKNVNLKKRSGRLSISWSKVAGRTSYTVYVSTKKPSNGSIKGMTKVKTTKSTSCAIKKFKGKKISTKRKYYVVVISNKKAGRTTYKSKPYYYFYK